MNSKLASVENLWQVKDQVKKVEEIAEEVLSLKNQVLALNKQKDQARVAWRALQKSDEPNVWLNFGAPFIEYSSVDAQELLKSDMKNIEASICETREALKKAADRLEKAQGSNKAASFNDLEAISAADVREFLKK
ncbi:unnamed protein product [Oikopleura dioica]|uniref:C20orf126-like protein n=1 Tax=Oikopleura dioica TaxID=34765 RepID=Q675R6_OIKDI|nr:C20orf126-like protein [Oikopleura dioica]CBY17865.1 unnamed protein product [Oikopleura dioica]CBY35266.1 unnamed protein product [Oikopleura dioica]CBY38555.1 unnamed protein product [Oikopleura dioica]